ncbi:MAG: SDR family oxidoreductase [Boseongicola sp.]|nr:SDR family oxidoreductase [Boseongicola sp.]MDD9979199.1 SDR family oxidoreductase [Boseongicola sp.]
MKHAVITGGTGGIGHGIAQVLASSGWTVTVTGATQAEVESFSNIGGVTSSVLDVTDSDAVTAFFAGLDQLNGMVNCAGILRKADEYEIDVFQQVLDVNITGTMRCCLAARPLLAASNGAIVNTGSMYSIFGGAHAPAYSASKGAVVQLTKALAGKWAADGIRVNAIAPGWIDTPMTKPIQGDNDREPAIMARTPLGRWGKPEEVGALVKWLLSEEASFITGALYPVDGGYSAM